MSIYLSDPRAAPDDDFEPGTLDHLVVGNTGRLLDPRRTPVKVMELRPATGFFVVRLEAFEDAGALWEVPLEHVGDHQFARGSLRADARTVAALRAAVARFDRPLAIEPAAAAAERTRRGLERRTAEARAWLARHSRFLAEGRALPDGETRLGDPALAADLQAWAERCGVAAMEARFARQWVSCPSSGEVVKGHRIVAAQLGLAPYAGTIVRDPATLRGNWSRARRARHLRARLAFVRALFDLLGRPTVALWRGVSSDEPLASRRGTTFVSATFSRRVAESHFGMGGAGRSRLLLSADVPAERLFMSFHETAAMNDPFREAEAVLLEGPGWPG